MKTEFRVPPFISKYFSSLDAEQKKEEIQRYKSWYKHDYTQLLLEDLENKLQKLIQEDEKETGFISRFQFNYKQAHNRAKRSLLRELTKGLKHEV